MSMNENQITIKVMTANDIPFAKSLTDNEKWGYLRSDFKRLIAHEPSGCFVASIGNTPVGIITSTSYNDYAFVGTLIVKSEHRNKKIGERLLRRAITVLEDKGVRTIELDGVFEAVRLYHRLGFKDKYLSLRLFRPGVPEEKEKDSIKPDPTEALLEFDKQKTRLNREPLLNRYLDEFSDSIFTINDGELSAYAVVRPSDSDCLIIGPCVAESYEAAEKLIDGIIDRYSTMDLSLGVPEFNRAMVNLLLRRGFVYNPPSLRMYRGEKREYERHIYAILSPEKG